MHNLVQVVLLALAPVLVYLANQARKERKKLPPGPKGLPIIGNALDFPRKNPAEVFASWKDKYGDVIYLNVLGTPIVVLNSLKACNELLDHRSHVYSDRPRFVMLNELMGWDFQFSTMGYNALWRIHRRLFHQHFNEGVVQDYHPAQERCTNSFIRRLLEDPDNFLTHIRLNFAESLLDIIYGIKVKGFSDAHVQAQETAVQISLEAAVPGRFLVDIFPILKYLPSWVPGVTFKKQAAKWKREILRMLVMPFDQTKMDMESGTAGPSVAGSMLTQLGHSPVELLGSELEAISQSPEEIIRGNVAIGYAAGADTTISTIQTFFLAMANYPEVQRAAQEELDTVVGTSQLPTFKDLKRLPYIHAVILEVLRWHSPVPLSIAHALSRDDEYNGYFLPKGTVVMPNIWLLLRDPATYADATRFDPSRWLVDTPAGKQLKTTVQDPSTIAFGFGRRKCPGRYYAQNSLFIAVSNVLACFDIFPKGSAQRVEERFTNKFISYPEPFELSITPRSADVLQLIQETQ